MIKPDSRTQVFPHFNANGVLGYDWNTARKDTSCSTNLTNFYEQGKFVKGNRKARLIKKSRSKDTKDHLLTLQQESEVRREAFSVWFQLLIKIPSEEGRGLLS